MPTETTNGLPMRIKRGEALDAARARGHAPKTDANTNQEQPVAPPPKLLEQEPYNRRLEMMKRLPEQPVPLQWPDEPDPQTMTDETISLHTIKTPRGSDVATHIAQKPQVFEQLRNLGRKLINRGPRYQGRHHLPPRSK